MELRKPDERQATDHDEFEAFVATLRRDFHRLFPQLQPRENECFFVKRDGDSSGKVWIEFAKVRQQRQVKCKITLVIEGNRAVRRIHEELAPEETLDDTALCPVDTPSQAARRR